MSSKFRHVSLIFFAICAVLFSAFLWRNNAPISKNTTAAVVHWESEFEVVDQPFLDNCDSLTDCYATGDSQDDKHNSIVSTLLSGGGGTSSAINKELPTTGTLRVAVLLVDYQDSGPLADREKSLSNRGVYVEENIEDSDYMDRTFSSTGFLNKFYKDMSYGQLNVLSTVFTWVRLPRDVHELGSTKCTYPTQAEIQKIITDKNIDLGSFDALLVYAKSQCLYSGDGFKVTKEYDAYHDDVNNGIRVKTVYPGELYQYGKTTSSGHAFYVQNPIDIAGRTLAAPRVWVPLDGGTRLTNEAPHSTNYALTSKGFTYRMPVANVNYLARYGGLFLTLEGGGKELVPYSSMFVSWHELGHLFGLQHPLGYDCPAGSYFGPLCSVNSNFANTFSAMYGGGAHSLSYSVSERAQLGWINTSNRLSINTLGSQVHSIGPLNPGKSDPGKLKRAAAITLPGQNSPVYYLEYRRSENDYDRGLNVYNTTGCREVIAHATQGLFLYRKEGNAYVLVDATPTVTSSSPDNKNDKCDVTLYGQNVFHDSEYGVDIGPILNFDENQITFRVTVTGLPRDTTVPTAALTGVVNNVTYLAPKTVQISANATDNYGVTKVEFYDGQTLMCTDTVAPYACAWSFTSEHNGSHVWTAKAYDAAGNYSISTPVTLKVNIPTTVPSTAPTIITPPQNKTVIVGQRATFGVVASGTAPLSYQWQKNGVNISGATSASYTTSVTTASDSGLQYRVIVSNRAGSITSAAGILTVTNVVIVRTPTILTPPQNKTVTAGQTATFSVVVSGTAPLSYQWQKNGVNIPGATSAVYATPVTTTADNNAQYHVIIANSAGSVASAPALLTVLGVTSPPPTPTPTLGADLIISNIRFCSTPPCATPTAGKATNLYADFRNQGTLSASGARISATVYTNGVLTKSLSTYSYASVAPNGAPLKPSWTSAFTPDKTSTYRFVITATVSGDVNAANNTASLEFTLAPRDPVAPTVSAGSAHQVQINTTHTHSGATATDANGDLASYAWTIGNCPAENCPVLTGNVSGSLVGTGPVQVPGPTFAALSAAGEYTLTLTVRDQAGNVTSHSVVERVTVEPPPPPYTLLGINSYSRATYFDDHDWVTLAGTISGGATKAAVAIWSAENNDTLTASNFAVTFTDTGCTITQSPSQWASRTDLTTECHLISSLSQNWSLNTPSTKSIIDPYCDFRYTAATKKFEYRDFSTSEDCGFAVFTSN